jgi:pilus assembly protein CpaB
MNMKWAIAGLIGLGLLAGLSALLLVSALRSEKMAELRGKGSINAVVAAKALPAMSLLTSQNTAIKKVPRNGLAADFFFDQAQVVGKMLARPVEEGQVLTKSALMSEGEGAQVAATLKPGMRAMSVPVSKHSVMGGLLYPGCLVDVVATFHLRYQDERGQAISTTLLHGVQVLAVQDESIMSKTEQEKAQTKVNPRGSENQLTVTLMVDTRQAEALQLAMDYGKVTLAMRNPLDQRATDSDAMVLSQGRLAMAGELLGPSVFRSGGDANSPDPNQMADETVNTEQLRRLFGEGRGSPQWQVTVIRGKDVKEEVVENSSAGEQK